MGASTSMSPGLEFAVVWHDEDVLQVRVCASTGSFSGAADVYCDHESPQAWAACLTGFPTTPGDQRELRLGAPGPGYAGGSAVLRFRTVDRAGHAEVRLEIEAEPSDRPNSQRVELNLTVEAAGIDRFVAALAKLSRTDVGPVVLSHAQ